MDMADYSPVTAKVASGVNAGTTIAGLKPWDQEWVFEGNPNLEHAQDVHPLIGPSNSESEMAELQQALAQIRGQVGAQVAGQAQMNPGGAQVSPNLREAQTRGDLDIADQTVAMQANPAERMQMAQAAQSGGAVAGNLGAQLHQQLKAMNGQMSEGVQGESGKAAPATKRVALGSGLSGAEFMNTLSVVRPGQQLGSGLTGASSGNTNDPSAQDEQSGGFGERSMGGLRVIEGAKGRSSANTGEDFVMASPAALHSNFQPTSPAQFQAPVMQMSGQVVPGSMAQDQLAHDAIMNMSTGIRNLSAQGGGEMRIRLKPENLGELHLRVVSQNGEIGIHIQASDDKAKKILQDSLGSLKDGLAAQNLTLGKVAIEVAQAGAGQDMRNDSRQHSSNQSGHQGQFQSQQQFGLEQNAGGNRNQREAQWSDPESQAIRARPLKSAASLMSGINGANSRGSEGRLDVMA